MSFTIAQVLNRAADGLAPNEDEALRLAAYDDLPKLLSVASVLRDQGHGDVVTYSRKVFIPLTQLCRDSCHYCTFAHPPRRGARAYLDRAEVLAIARDGERAGCKEALFTLGDKPESRYAVARQELADLGHATTLDYLHEVAGLVLKETGLLPHINAGVMGREDIDRLRGVSVSQGIMLESASERLCARGGPHFGSPDKRPHVRLETIAAAGDAAVPFTSGLLIGIGETRRERIEALLELRRLHDAGGHLQELIIQNFRAKPGTRMQAAAEPDTDDHLWTIAVARILFGSAMNIQAPPNLRPEALGAIIAAGANDWGGVSPVTPDHVNPEAPWPQITQLARATAAAGKTLVERLAAYPAYVCDSARWIDPALRSAVMKSADGAGFARPDGWIAGADLPLPAPAISAKTPQPALEAIITRARRGDELAEAEIVQLFETRGAGFERVCEAADDLRADMNGDAITYVVTRNINYTNVCSFRCKFCAFSKGKLSENLRGRPYDLDEGEIERRVHEAWARGGTEVCLQGGIHPDYTGETYLRICQTVKRAAPDIHVHAFSPLEVWQGATTLGLPLATFLAQLRDAGLSSLPGTAAEILDDEVRAVICPDKINTAQWLEVIETAHRVGLRSTATIMFGHVDRYEHWARHILRLRRLQARTGGITEFVPLPFVPMETPIYLRGGARRGPSFREAVLMHAVARLALHPLIPNIQTSWVKMGPGGVGACLRAGANDLGGTLMDESITRAAGAMHGQELAPERMEAVIRGLGRTPRQRTTLYGDVPTDRIAASFTAAPLAPRINTPVGRSERKPVAAAAE